MSHNTVIPSSSFKLTSGQPKIFVDTAASGNKLYRAFCPDCGSAIYSQREKMPEMMILKVGSLDESNEMKVVMNVWMKSARAWLHIDRKIESHEGNRPVKT